MKTTLFLDDEPLTRKDNIRRGVGTARRVEESVYHDPCGNCAWGYPAVFANRDLDDWLLLYGVSFGIKSNAGGGRTALAHSTDGIHWTPDKRAASIDSPNRQAPHQVCGNVGFSSGFALDDSVDGLDRYNMLAHTKGGAGQLWTSPDCLRWRLVEGAGWQDPNPDPPTFVHWNPMRNRFVLSTRPDHSDRRIALFETSDFREYSPLELALQTDSQDRSLTQIYGMPIFEYEGWFVGLPWMFDISAAETESLPHKYLGGKQYAQLAYSVNGWHWQRSLRQPFIGNGDPGEPDAGCVQPSSMVRLADGSLRFYASTSRHEHGHCPPDDGYIVGYQLRRDGFVYLESDGGVGVIGTRPLYWGSGEVEVNAQSPAGWTKVQVTDPQGKVLDGYGFEDCDILRDDDPAWVPKWKDSKTLEALTGRMIRLEVHLENSRLYAIRGDFVECRASDVRRLEADGTKPSEQQPWRRK